jgi:hypothetical protein
MTDMDFSGFDNAAAGALFTDLDVAGLDGATDGMSLPDPVDDIGGTDFADVTDGTDLPGIDVVELDVDPDAEGWATAGPPIVASDGTAYDSYADFLRGPGPGRG